MADAGGHLGPVLLDLHAPAAAMAELAPGQVPVDVLRAQLEPGRQALHEGGQARSVRLAGGDEAQRHPVHTLLAESRSSLAGLLAQLQARRRRPAASPGPSGVRGARPLLAQSDRRPGPPGVQLRRQLRRGVAGDPADLLARGARARRWRWDRGRSPGSAQLQRPGRDPPPPEASASAWWSRAPATPSTRSPRVGELGRLAARDSGLSLGRPRGSRRSTRAPPSSGYQ